MTQIPDRGSIPVFGTCDCLVQTRSRTQDVIIIIINRVVLPSVQTITFSDSFLNSLSLLFFIWLLGSEKSLIFTLLGSVQYRSRTRKVSTDISDTR